MSRIDRRHRVRRPGLSKKIALMGIFAAVAIVLSIVENLLTGMFNFAIPGLKPGLANLAVVLALYYLGGGYALVDVYKRQFGQACRGRAPHGSGISADRRDR